MHEANATTLPVHDVPSIIVEKVALCLGKTARQGARPAAHKECGLIDRFGQLVRVLPQKNPLSWFLACRYSIYSLIFKGFLVQ